MACAISTLLGCDPVSPPPDDAGPEEDGSAGAAVILLRLGVEEDESADWELESAYARLAEVRGDNDRGSDLEPVWVDPGRVRLDDEASEVRVPAVPATYGGVTLRSADGSGFTIELSYRTPGARVIVRSRRSFDLALRCESGGVSLPAAGEITLEVQLDVGAVAAQLEMAELPEPVDGEIVLDESTAPSVVADVEASLPGAWSLDCETE